MLKKLQHERSILSSDERSILKQDPGKEEAKSSPSNAAGEIPGVREGSPNLQHLGPRRQTQTRWLGNVVLLIHRQQPLKTQTSALCDWAYICQRHCQQPGLPSHTMAKYSHAFTSPNQGHTSAHGCDAAGLLTDATKF